MTKVFGIGFHKTGTKTLKQALTILGYKVSGPNLELVDELSQNKYDAAFELVNRFDAFQDNPWPLLYKTLDENFEGSKFILTRRDDEKWIKSVVNYFEYRVTDMREWIYGVGHPKGNEDIYLKTYQQHNEKVIEYFKQRPNDLLVLDFSKGDGWETICQFLNRDIPLQPFPHANKGNYSKWKNWKRGYKKYIGIYKK